MMAASPVKAAPVQFNQVMQMINAKPGKASTGGFAELRLAGDDPLIVMGDDTKTNTPPVAQDDRVITETRSEIIEEEVCDCDQPKGGAFPYWTLGFAGLPLIFLIPPGGTDRNPPPTPTPTPTTETPTPTPTTPTPTPTTPTPTPTTPTPTPTPTTPTPTPTPRTPTPTPTPTTPKPTPTPPEPVPEPMTILLFGTGLASIGLAARRKFGKKDEEETEE